MKAIPDSELRNCLAVLRKISQNTELIDEHIELKTLLAKINRKARKASRQKSLDQKRKHDSIVRANLNQGNAQTLEERTLLKTATCHICRKPYVLVDFDYKLLCPDCATFNKEKVNQKTNLRGYTVLLTGGRIKIGYQTALRCLRDGAKVIVTTRFPQDAMRRYQNENDFEIWEKRLHIYAIDLRNLRAVHDLVDYIHQNEPHLDILINNAAQTISRPIEFYAHLIKAEKLLDFPHLINPQESIQDRLLEANRPRQADNFQPLLDSDFLGLSTRDLLDFPTGQLDQDGQQLDLRQSNSWVLELDEVTTHEMVEVQLVNSVAPFILCSKLKPLFINSPNPRRFIINVSAMEGQFNRQGKTSLHPHTNMAKAALNMLTRTSAQEYAQKNIYMNSVDTGWITNENPHLKSEEMADDGFEPPLSILDGVARIYDPICQGIQKTETPIYGQFLKNYSPYDW